jgi:hypothetical protein
MMMTTPVGATIAGAIESPVIATASRLPPRESIRVPCEFNITCE